MIDMPFDPETLDWDKVDGLMPAVVQDVLTAEVLMLGYMNREALEITSSTGRVTFFSRTQQALWTKGETSGNFLETLRIVADCDADTLLVMARPAGPVCHVGTQTCFGEFAGPDLAFLGRLDRLVEARESERPTASYTTRLFEEGSRRIAQKVGEEGVETALAGAAGDRAELAEESADLIYHLMVLLRSRGMSMADVAVLLASRHQEQVTS
jgi:phosphoribosyl-ATP pyrophosphohydrolase/phosphoribosyl-AMP cyclohydrolase